MHPSERIYKEYSDVLEGKKIVFVVSGSIAAINSIKTIRELIRRGAEVFPVVTEDAKKIVGEAALQFATGKEVISEIDGRVQHVAMCGESGSADCIVVAPATMNFIGKVANGIADDCATTVVLTAIGSKKPTIFIPAMHISMWNSKITKRNIKVLEDVGVLFLNPKIDENKAKFPDSEYIVESIVRSFRKGELNGKKVLVTAGSTREWIDDVRFISNPSSGKMGIELAKEFYSRGADVKLVCCSCMAPFWIEQIRCDERESMFKAVSEELKKGYDIFVCASAISDFMVKRVKGKLSSSMKHTIEMRPAEKLIEIVRENFPDIFLVAFKADIENIVEKGKKLLKVSDIVFANPLSSFSSDYSEGFLITPEYVKEVKKMKKRKVAEIIVDEVSRRLCS